MTDLRRPSSAAAPPGMILVMKMPGSSPMCGLSVPPAMLKPNPELPCSHGKQSVTTKLSEAELNLCVGFQNANTSVEYVQHSLMTTAFKAGCIEHPIFRNSPSADVTEETWPAAVRILMFNFLLDGVQVLQLTLYRSLDCKTTWWLSYNIGNHLCIKPTPEEQLAATVWCPGTVSLVLCQPLGCGADMRIINIHILIVGETTPGGEPTHRENMHTPCWKAFPQVETEPRNFFWWAANN